MTPPRGPFAVIVRRTADGWYRVTGLYQGSDTRLRWRPIARSCAGHSRDRADAVECVRAVAR